MPARRARRALDLTESHRPRSSGRECANSAYNGPVCLLVRDRAHSNRADRQHPPAQTLIDAVAELGSGIDPALDPLYDEAIRNTIASFEATGSPVITDGEQRKYHNFWTYCVQGLPNTAPDGFKIPFAAGTRPANAAFDARTVPLPAICGRVSECSNATRPCR